MGKGDKIKCTASKEGTRFVLIAGKPLNEPVVQVILLSLLLLLILLLLLLLLCYY